MLSFCTRDNRIFEFFIFLLSFSDIIIETCSAGVLIETGFIPLPGFKLDSCEIVMPGNSQPHPPYLDAYYVFPATLGYNPKIIMAIREMQWEGSLYFEYQNYSQTNSYMLIRLTLYPNTTNNNIYLLRFNLILYEDTHYNLLIYDFIYNTSATTVEAQSFSVTIPSSSVAILTGYSDIIDSNYVPSATTPNILQNAQTISIDNNNGLTGYMITYFLYKVVQVVHSVMYDVGTYYKTRLFYYNCDLNTTCTSTIMFFENSMPNKCFDGVMGFTAISSISQNASFRFNLSIFSVSISNVRIIIFSHLLSYQICPSTSKYFSARHILCFPQCPDTTYLVPRTHAPANYYYKYYCELCASYCLTCTLEAGNCTSCFDQDRYLLTNSTLNYHVCICPADQYGIPPYCSNCNQTILFCVKCDSDTNCLECDAGLIFNPVSLICECPPSLQPALNNFTYINANNISITVGKLRCISKKIVENCMDSVLTIAPPLDFNIFAYGQTCSCVTGGEYLDNKCI